METVGFPEMLAGFHRLYGVISWKTIIFRAVTASPYYIIKAYREMEVKVHTFLTVSLNR
jgi:hypothetical protein